MSFGLYWEPVPNVTGHRLEQALKYVVAGRWFGHDGSLRGETVLDKHSIAYLNGIRDCNTTTAIGDAATDLIEAIEAHGSVRVWIGDSDS